MAQEQSMELSKDQIIQELIALLNQNQQKAAANDVFEMAALIDSMERKLELVTQELEGVRKQLEKMEQEKAEKNLKAAVRKAVDSLEQQCNKMKEQLFEIKAEVKEKTAEIVAEVKQNGKKALNKVSEFLRIREKLQKICQNVQESISDVDKIIAKIDALGTGMREAMQKAANTIRSFTDKPEKEYGEKRFSKTELLKKPLQAKRRLLSGILSCADAAIIKVEKISDDIKLYQSERTEQENECIVGGRTEMPVAHKVAQQKYQYGAENFETQQAKAEKIMNEIMAVKVVPARDSRKR